MVNYLGNPSRKPPTQNQCTAYPTCRRAQKRTDFRILVCQMIARLGHSATAQGPKSYSVS